MSKVERGLRLQIETLEKFLRDEATTASCEIGPPLDGPPPGQGTNAGNLCRLQARLEYLQQVLWCEENHQVPQPCCDAAYEQYEEDHAACPF